MIVRRHEHGRDSKMPCESCAVQFSMFKRKRVCSECERCYCSACLRRGGGVMCAPCRVLSTRPLARPNVAHLRVRDLQCFLQRQNVSTRGCVEKEELVSLCVSHVNSAAYRRRGARPAPSAPFAPGAFSSLKGLTSNINVFLNSAFDLRSSPPSAARPAPPPPHHHHPRPTTPPPPHSCHNGTHSHAPRAPPDRFTTTPGGERDISVPVPEGAAAGAVGAAGVEAGAGGARRVDTADCYEIEDLDERGWEVVRAPARPLPNDSDVLLSTTEGSEPVREDNPAREQESAPPDESENGSADGSPPGSPRATPGAPPPASPRAPPRAASELELRRARSHSGGDSGSLQDHPLMDNDGAGAGAGGGVGAAGPVTLDQVEGEAALEALSARQLKELLARNRVPFRGCVERAELLARARTLWRDHRRLRHEVDALPLEECCKICMAAPLECVLLECGHIAACTACSRQLAECPICRQYVVRAVRCFRA